MPSAVTIERPSANDAPQTTPEHVPTADSAARNARERSARERFVSASHESTRPAPEPATGSLRRYLVQVVLATSLVALCPMLIVWWLRSSGVLTTYVLGMLLGVGLSLGAAHVGRVVWQTRPGSQHLLFSELMIWGFIRRCYSERRLASARAVLGSMNHAQLRMANGLSAEDQTRQLEALAKALDASDPNTHGHSRRVARYAWMIATRMGLPREEVARIRTAAAVHDVGKIKTPRAVLRKAGPLTDEEFAVIKRHAADGARMAVALNDEGLTEMVLHHHERMDGSGYPSRLAGKDIPLGARIIAVADTFDSITANRPYRTARTHKEAIDVLVGEGGTKLDADAVRAFCSHYSGRRPLTLWAWLTTLPERLVAQFGGGLTGVASTAKALALATIVGSLAAGTASLARPSLSSSQRTRLPSATAARAVTAVAPQPAGVGARARISPGASGARHGAAHPRGAHRIAASHTSGTPARTQGGAGATPSTPAGSVQTSPTETPSASAKGHGAEAPSHASEAGGGGAHEGSGHEVSSARPEEHRSGSEQGKGKSEGTQTKSEAGKSSAGGVVGETVGKVEEVKGKAVEEVKGKVEEVKGKTEEVTGKTIEAVKGKTEEVTGKTIEAVKGKTEEVTGKAKEVLGKL